MSKLPNAPLQEVIFEIRWALDVNEDTNQYLDTGFELAAGSLRSILKKDFPLLQRKVPHEIPSLLLNYVTVYQYRKKKNTWPVIQHGPGILTVNDNDQNYEWETTFLPLISESLSALIDSYETPLEFNSVGLRYVDSVKARDFGFQGNWYEFLDKTLNFNVNNSFDYRGEISDFQINQNFQQPDGSNLIITASSGKTKKTSEPLLFWQIEIKKKGKIARNDVMKWLQTAHDITSETFKKIVKKEIYERFAGT